MSYGFHGVDVIPNNNLECVLAPSQEEGMQVTRTRAAVPFTKSTPAPAVAVTSDPSSVRRILS